MLVEIDPRQIFCKGSINTVLHANRTQEEQYPVDCA